MDKTGFATLWRDQSDRADHPLRRGIITLATGITSEQGPLNPKASTPMLKSQKNHQNTQPISTHRLNCWHQKAKKNPCIFSKKINYADIEPASQKRPWTFEGQIDTSKALASKNDASANSAHTPNRWQPSLKRK